MSNQAAWLKSAKAKALVVDETAIGKPGPGQLLIKNHAIAINPVDWKIQDYGVVIEKYPTILGQDVAGEIVEVGEGVTKFRKGDRVAAHCLALVTRKNEEAGFQNYTIVHEITTSALPDSINYDAGAVLPLAISTAAAGLYLKDFLNLPFPKKDAKPTGKSLLVWGAASSVGALTIQLAIASGVKVIATASAKHHSWIKELGVTEVFNYKDSDIEAALVKALKEAGEFAGVYDAVSLPDTVAVAVKVTEKLGGGFIACTLAAPKDLPSGVKAGTCFAPVIGTQAKEVGKAVWGEYVPGALADGSLKPKPDAFVVGSGLSSVQKGLDANKAGVSGQKVVISL